MLDLLKQSRNANDTIKKALLTLFEHELMQLSEELERKEKISKQELKRFLVLHEVYKLLGGNGYFDEIKKNIIMKG
jgi:hypothetical protein